VDDWLSLVANGACAERPDHIRHNAVDAIRMAAQSVVNLACRSRTTDHAWNALALRSGCHSIHRTAGAFLELFQHISFYENFYSVIC